MKRSPEAPDKVQLAPRIAVVGAGGLGGYFGARLVRSGADVSFLARGEHLEVMQERGLRVRSVHGDFHVAPGELHAKATPAEIGPVDFVLFTVKSYDTVEAATSIPPLLNPSTAVISLQNGIDNETKIGEAIGVRHVVGGAAYVFAGIAEPGVIRHDGGPTRIVVGEMEAGHGTRLVPFLDACTRAGFGAEISDNIRSVLWTKFAFICAQAGMTAATGLPIGEVRADAAARACFRRVVLEVQNLAAAEGVVLPEDLADRHLSLADGLEPTAYSSLHDDMVGHRRMELDALLGEVVRRAYGASVPVPTTATLFAILAPWAARNQADRTHRDRGSGAQGVPVGSSRAERLRSAPLPMSARSPRRSTAALSKGPGGG